MRGLKTACVAVAAMIFALGLSHSASAEQQHKRTRVLDADYRGTLTCAKTAFTDYAVRETIVVSIDDQGKTVGYTHVVRLKDAPEPGEEKGTGKLDGDKIKLLGDWKGDAGAYHANYEGSFVRRRVKLIGTQTWTREGKIVTRMCTGVVTRAFRAFLPRKKAAAAQP